MPESMQITNREIARIHAALTALSGRRLSGPENRKKVVTLLRRYFEVPHQIIEDLRTAIIKDHPAPESWESESLPIGVAEARMGAINDLMNDTQEIGPIPPHLFIKETDLPKPIKGELGDQNEAGVADIQHKLGFLFPLDDEE